MSRKELGALALATAAGFFGGSLSTGLTPVFAQGRMDPGFRSPAINQPYVIHARSFVVVDTRGATRAELGVDSTGNTILNLYDQRGQKTFSVPPRGVIPVSQP